MNSSNQRIRCAGLVLLFVFLAGRALADNWPPALPVPVIADEAPGRLPPSVQAEPAGARRWKCTFTYAPKSPVKSVTLAGTFNQWNRGATPFTGPDADGRWSATVTIESGVQYYKFVVDGSQWIADPQNDDTIGDGQGGSNAVLRLGRMAQMKTSEAKSGDGRIDSAGLEHNPELPLYWQTLRPDEVLVRCRTLAGDVEKVEFAAREGPRAQLALIEHGTLFDQWEARIRLPAAAGPTTAAAGSATAPAGRRIAYTFVFTDGPARLSDPMVYEKNLSSDVIFQTPEWARHAIWYQIMLERFRNGDPANDPQPVRPWTSEWFTPSPWEGKDGQTFYKHYVFDRFYGGDFEGLEQKLPYLKELGVNALYLNPVFKANSHHKYNATSFIHIDDAFGTKGDYEQAAAREETNDPASWTWTESDKRFLQFLKAAKAQGFRVIIDGVFNHVGTAHPAFMDVQARGEKSPYADWFEVTSWKPFKYEGWAGFGALPAFKKNREGLASRSLVEHLHAITRRWMDPDGDGDPRDGVDGWRLDVPGEIPLPFWATWRDLVKSINPDAYITGEVWERADAWLDGRHFDAVMNYEFARPAISWICHRDKKIVVSECDRRLRELRQAYPHAATLVMQNLVDSHDTDRLVSMVANPDNEYDRMNRVQDDNPKYDNDKPDATCYARARLVALLQMTYIGAPMIYYGDEVGMWGADDPTNRKPMLWKDLEPYEKSDVNFVMTYQLDYYKMIIALRNTHTALRTGAFQTLLADDFEDVWAFQRSDERERVIVILNASNNPRTPEIPLPGDAPSEWRAVFGPEGLFKVIGGKLAIPIPPISGVVLQAVPK